MYTEIKKVTNTELISLIEEITDPVISTLGPNGKNCILFNGIDSPHVTKDGVTVAKNLRFSDMMKRALHKIFLETSLMSNELVGDGTTTSMLLARKLSTICLNSNDPVSTFLRIQKDLTETIIPNLLKAKRSFDVLDEDSNDIIKSICFTSSNGDKEISNLIMDAVNKIGVDGLFDVKESKGQDTYTEIIDGVLIESKAHTHSTLEFSNPKVLLVHGSIHDSHTILSALNLAASDFKSNGTPYIIIAKEFGNDVIKLVNENNFNKRLAVILVEAEGFAESMLDILEDMSYMLKCKILSSNPKSPLRLEDVKPEHFVQIDSATVSPTNTILYNTGMLDDESCSMRRELIIEILKRLKTSGGEKIGEIKLLKRRLSKFSKTAKIYVGAATPVSKKEKKDRVDDVTLAIASAINHGVLPGGGYALWQSCQNTSVCDEVKELCEYPSKVIYNGIDCNILEIFSRGNILNVRNKVEEAASVTTILDAADTQIAALKQALSITGTLINSSNFIISEWQDMQEE